MEEWKVIQLKEVCELIPGFAFKSSEFGEHEYSAIKIGDIQPPYVHEEGLTGVDISRYSKEKLEKFKVYYGDFVLAMTGATIGKIGRYIGTSGAYINQRVLLFRPKENVNKEYIYYCLQTPVFQQYIFNHIDSQTAQPNISAGSVSGFEILLPCISIQNKIADILSALDSKIELNNRINHNLEEQAQIVFDRIFNSDLTNNCLLSSIVDINPKRTLRKNEVARCIDMTYLNTAGSFPSGWEFKPYSGGMKFINGDTLMARITPCLENGKVAYINFLDKEETAFGSTEYIVFHAKEGYPNEMFYFLTRNKAFIEFATKNMNGSSGRQRVSGETIGNYIIPVLSEDDINELKTVSESTMKEILKNNLESRVLSEMRNTILPKLMSGELKINDLTC